MLEIGIASYIFHREIRDERTMTLLDVPQVCKALGVQTIELVSSFFANQSAPYLNDVREAIQAQGLSVRNIAVDTGNIANPDDASRRTDIEAIMQWFHVAGAVGSQAIRVNSGTAPPDDPEAIARIIASYRELAAEAARTGVYMLIENHGGASNDPRIVQALLDEVASPWFKTCPDTGNFTDGLWEEGMRVMAPHAFTCHVKAASYSPDGWQERVGHDGTRRTADLKQCFQILRDAGYSGPLCIEGGASDDGLGSARDMIRYVRELLATA